MTEKHYGGSSSFGFNEKPTKNQNKDNPQINKNELKQVSSQETDPDLDLDLSVLKKVGSIASETRAFAIGFIKPGMPLLEIAEKIESKIIELGASPAFPTNLSIDEVAAHATPKHNSEEVASGLLKVDLGCHINGFIADTAISINLSENKEEAKENQELIETANSCLQSALSEFKLHSPISQIGEAIESTAIKQNALSIKNLSGHSISQYDLHSGFTIPNFNNSSPLTLDPGLYAIEPFVTLSSGSGKVKEGKPSGIYQLQSDSPVRDATARKILAYIKENYETLPFCSRWLYKSFGPRALLALRQLESQGIIHHYAQLVESSGKKVAQAEHTCLLTEKEKIITTE